jgi:hypothetical protein
MALPQEYSEIVRAGGGGCGCFFDRFGLPFSQYVCDSTVRGCILTFLLFTGYLVTHARHSAVLCRVCARCEGLWGDCAQRAPRHNHWRGNDMTKHSTTHGRSQHSPECGMPSSCLESLSWPSSLLISQNRLSRSFARTGVASNRQAAARAEARPQDCRRCRDQCDSRPNRRGVSLPRNTTAFCDPCDKFCLLSNQVKAKGP